MKNFKLGGSTKPARTNAEVIKHCLSSVQPLSRCFPNLSALLTFSAREQTQAVGNLLGRWVFKPSLSIHSLFGASCGYPFKEASQRYRAGVRKGYSKIWLTFQSSIKMNTPLGGVTLEAYDIVI